MHDLYFGPLFHDDHEHHGHDRVEDSVLWKMDNIELKSVGIDIGSAGTQVIFSRLKLERKGEDLTSRYVIVSRESIYRSPVQLTPYTDDERIDDQALGMIIDDAYQKAGFKPEDIHTGAVILTGEAIRRQNAQAIGDLVAAQGGDFVCATAGHNMEALLAAYGSGAAYESYKQRKRILNVDIGGGTTKLAVVENGQVLDTAALYIGGRLVVFDENRCIERLDPGGKHIANILGYSWEIGDKVTDAEIKNMTSWMAEAILSVIEKRVLPKEIENLFLTPALQEIEHVDGVMFSGGVGEYVYENETQDFGDLGKSLGQNLRQKFIKDSPWSLLPAGECIRATVVGASEYSLQVSGNTIYISDPNMLPQKNLQVLHPSYQLKGEIDAVKLAESIGERYAAFDLIEGEADVALAFRWYDDPSYERVNEFIKGVEKALQVSIELGKPLVLVFDGDIARTVGTLLKEERKIKNDILSIDGISLQEFDFIDIGQILYPSGTVPVTIKSLIFQL
jgi:ethanolamine utilization protein EutA